MTTIKIVVSLDNPFSFLSRYSKYDTKIDDQWWFGVDHYTKTYSVKSLPLHQNLASFVTSRQLYRSVMPIDVFECRDGFPNKRKVSLKYKNQSLEFVSRSITEKNLEKSTLEKFKQHIYLITPLLQTRKSSFIDTECLVYGGILESIREKVKKFYLQTTYPNAITNTQAILELLDHLLLNLPASSGSVSKNQVMAMFAILYDKTLQECTAIINAIDINQFYTLNRTLVEKIRKRIKTKVQNKECKELAILIVILLNKIRQNFKNPTKYVQS